MKKVNLLGLMVAGLGFNENGAKAYKTKILKQMEVENASEVFFVELEVAQEFVSIIGMTKAREEVAKTVVIEEYLEIPSEIKVGRKSEERKGTMADLREFISANELEEKFKEFLSVKYVK